MMALDQRDRLQVEEVTRELPLDWTLQDAEELLRALQPYVRWIESYIASGVEIPSHVPESGSIAVPIGETTTPEALFGALGPDVAYRVHEYDEYWVTIHYPNPQPVVTLLPKVLPGLPEKLVDLCERCSAELGVRVGGVGAMFMAWLLPRFSWAMHTDHDNKYEMVAARVQYPLMTTPRSLFVWGKWDDDGEEEWLLTKHLPAGRAHFVRVDVPHTVINAHPSKSRLHLILDVHDA